MRMRPFGQLLPPEEALRRLLAEVRPVREIELVPLARAVGRVAARTVRARRPVPAFARATWDGYAVRSRDTVGASRRRPRQLRIIGEIYAPTFERRGIRAGEAAAIATGGAMPRGADAVVIFEVAPERLGTIELRAPLSPGERVAAIGEDFPRGEPLARAGALLTPATVGALAASGERSVAVRRRPRVTVLPNGDELAPPGARLGPRQIFESNNLTLSALLAGAGADPRPGRIVRDDPRVIAAAIRRALGVSDAVLVTGGSSVGEHDYLPQVLPRIGRLLFHGLAVRPGKPTLAAVAGGKLVVGMPGHPTSCLSNGFWLLLPVLRRLASLPGPGTVRVPARMARPYPLEPTPLATVVPLRVDGEGKAWPMFHGSSAITSLAGANGYVLLPPGHRGLRRGVRLTVELLPPPLGGLPVP